MRSLRYLVSLVVLLLLMGCADHNKRALVTQTPDMPVGKIKLLDVVLELRNPITDLKTKESLNARGWDDGSFARYFASELSKHFAKRGIKVGTITSKWGPIQQIPSTASSVDVAQFSMVIEPIRILYLVERRYGVERVMDNFSLDSKVSIYKNSQSIWIAQEFVGVAPVDSSGAHQFSISILNALADSKLIEPR